MLMKVKCVTYESLNPTQPFSKTQHAYVPENR